MPQRVTIERAVFVTLCKSPDAPVLISPSTRASAMRPPSATRISANSCALVL